ncbi:MAG: hypothetical protein KY455_06285 [Euryarchaeota archaeon]|nr:hypothetical protein [Euryarchaeota archaeon]
MTDRPTSVAAQQLARSRSRLPDLPKCQARPEGFVLSSRQRREIIEALARHGKAGLEAWLKKEEKRDPYIRKRIKEEEERLRLEAERERRQAERAHGERKAARESQWERRMRETAEREAALRDQIRKTRETPVLDLNELETDSELYRSLYGKEKRGVLDWIVYFFQTVWYFLLFVVSRFFRFVRRLFGKKEAPPRTTVTLPDGTRLSIGGAAWFRPGVRAQIRYKMKEGEGLRERLRRMWDRLLGREDYAETAARLMQDEIDRRSEQHRMELSGMAADLEQRLKDLERTENIQRRERKEDLERLEEDYEKDLERLAKNVRQGPYEQMRDELLGDLAMSGLVDEKGDAKSNLLERFSGILYDEALRTLPAGGMATPGRYVEGEGEYQKGPLRSLTETGMMELVDSVVQARQNHPKVRHLFDDDILVHREVRTAKTHVVLIFDQSGSMEEKGRMEAAKTVCLVMYRAIKEQGSDHRVDILAMSTGVEQVDLAGCWNAEPKGFTNHGAALREARYLLEDEAADRRLVYLITDGLPEAMTVRGVDTADRPEVCMPYALEQAALLGDTPGTRLMVIQLETEDEQYVQAARDIANAANGTVEVVEPQALTEKLLVDLETVTKRQEAAV